MLVLHPATSSYSTLVEAEREQIGIREELMRLLTGMKVLEDIGRIGDRR